jgi:hypothetical protein
VLASQTVASANGHGATPSCPARARTTGVSRTAVVSSESSTVVTEPSSTTSSHSQRTDPRPPRAARAAADWKTPAASASSATTVMVSRKTRIGAARARVSHSHVFVIEAAHSSVTTRSSRCGRPGLRGGPGVGSALYPRPARVRSSCSGVLGSAPLTKSSRTRRPLVALLKWLTTVRELGSPRRRSWSTRTVTVRSAAAPVARHSEAYPVDRRSMTSPRAVTDAMAAASGSRQCSVSVPTPGSTTLADKPVRRDPVGEPQHAPQAAEDQDRASGPAPGRGRQRAEPEGVVEDPGVQVGGRPGRGGEQLPVGVDLAGQSWGEPERGLGRLRLA